MGETIRDVYIRVRDMRETVEKIALAQSSMGEQDILAVGVISIDSVLELARTWLPGDPVFQKIDALITPEHVRPDGAVRAIEMLVLLRAIEGSLYTAAGIGKARVSSAAGPRTDRRWRV